MIERIFYVIIILFCLYRLTETKSCIDKFDPEITHPSFIGYV